LSHSSLKGLICGLLCFWHRVPCVDCLLTAPSFSKPLQALSVLSQIAEVAEPWKELSHVGDKDGTGVDPKITLLGAKIAQLQER
jgi:hypothetical protein